MFYSPFRKPSPVLTLGAAPAKRAAKAAKAVSLSASLGIGLSDRQFIISPFGQMTGINTPYNHSCSRRPQLTVTKLQRTGGCVNTAHGLEIILHLLWYRECLAKLLVLVDLCRALYCTT